MSCVQFIKCLPSAHHLSIDAYMYELFDYAPGVSSHCRQISRMKLCTKNIF